MSGHHCVQAVFTALTPVEGILSADVSVGTAVIEHDGRATGTVLRQAIAVAGYDAEVVGDDRRQLPIL